MDSVSLNLRVSGLTLTLLPVTLRACGHTLLARNSMRLKEAGYEESAKGPAVDWLAVWSVARDQFNGSCDIHARVSQPERGTGTLDADVHGAATRGFGWGRAAFGCGCNMHPDFDYLPEDVTPTEPV